VFEKAYTAKEVKLVADAIGIAARDANKREFEFLEVRARLDANLQLLEHKVNVISEQLERALTPSAVREPLVPQEEVFLVPPSGPATAGDPPHDLRNKIGLIKAVREVSNLGLKEAKDLVEHVIDRGFKMSVFKGPLEKAAVAVRILKAAGGTVERKESI